MLKLTTDKHEAPRGLSATAELLVHYVTFIQFKICCCVQNFIKIECFFTQIWRYIDFQNGTVRHLGIVLPLYG